MNDFKFELKKKKNCIEPITNNSFHEPEILTIV